MNENYYNHIIFNPFGKSINPIIMMDFLLILFSLYLLKIDYSLFFFNHLSILKYFFFFVIHNSFILN